MLALTRRVMLALIGVIAHVGLTIGSQHNSNPYYAFCAVEHKGSMKVPLDVELMEDQTFVGDVEVKPLMVGIEEGMDSQSLEGYHN